MARNLYCWRCDMVLPMLEDHEWEVVAPLLRDSLSELQRYRQEHDVSLAEAKDQILGLAALDKYRELTGFNETNIKPSGTITLVFMALRALLVASLCALQRQVFALLVARCGPNNSFKPKPLRGSA